MRIVVVDDSPLLRDRIKDLFKNLKNVEIVGEAVNGLDGLRLIENIRPDLAILDIRLPEMNGIEILKKIREKGINIKICMLTSYPYKQYKDRCMAEGSDYFFDKNHDIQQILDVVTKLAN